MRDDQPRPNLQRRERRKKDELTENKKDQRQRAVGADATVAHDFQCAVFRPPTAKAVKRVSESVLVKAISNECCEHDCAQHGGRERQHMWQHEKDERRSAADYYTYQRKECRCFAEFCFRAVDASRDRQSSQELNGKKEASKEPWHSYHPLSLTPASWNVAISLSSFAATSMTCIARAAPVPSPSLIERSSSGCSPMWSIKAICPSSADRCPLNK